MTVIRHASARAVARAGCAAVFSAVLAVGFCAPATSAQTRYEYDRTTTGFEYLVDTASYHGYWDGFARGTEDLKIGPEFKAGGRGLPSRRGRLHAGHGSVRKVSERVPAGVRPRLLRCPRRPYRDPLMNVPPAPPDPLTRPVEIGVDAAPLVKPGILGTASTRGYDAGYSQGASDHSSGGSYGYRDDEIYLLGAAGYDADLGDEDQYKAVFRQIYARGYSDGFNGRASYTDTEILADREPAGSASDVLEPP